MPKADYTTLTIASIGKTPRFWNGHVASTVGDAEAWMIYCCVSRLQIIAADESLLYFRGILSRFEITFPSFRSWIFGGVLVLCSERDEQPLYYDLGISIDGEMVNQ